MNENRYGDRKYKQEQTIQIFVDYQEYFKKHSLFNW